MQAGAGSESRVVFSTVGRNTEAECEVPDAEMTVGVASPSLYPRAARAAAAIAEAPHVHLLGDRRFRSVTV